MKFKSGCQIIDLSPSANYKIEVFDLHAHKIYFCKVLPAKEGEFYLFDGSNVILANKNKILEIFNNVKPTVCFNTSGTIWNFNREKS